MRQRLDELEIREAALPEQREGMNEPAPTRQLRPNATNTGRAKVADREVLLNAPAIRAEASDDLRALIERVVLTPSRDVTSKPTGLPR